MTHHRAPGDRTTQDLALNRIGFHQPSLPSCPVCTGEVAERSPEAWALDWASRMISARGDSLFWAQVLRSDTYRRWSATEPTADAAVGRYLDEVDRFNSLMSEFTGALQPGGAAGLSDATEAEPGVHGLTPRRTAVPSEFPKDAVAVLADYPTDSEISGEAPAGSEAPAEGDHGETRTVPADKPKPPPPPTPEGGGGSRTVPPKCCPVAFEYPSPGSVKLNPRRVGPARLPQFNDPRRRAHRARVSFTFRFRAVFAPAPTPCSCRCCEFGQDLVRNVVTLRCRDTEFSGRHFDPGEGGEDCTWTYTYIDKGLRQKGANYYRTGPRNRPPPPYPPPPESVLTAGPRCPGARKPIESGIEGVKPGPADSGYGGNDCTYHGGDRVAIVVPPNCSFTWFWMARGYIRDVCGGGKHEERLFAVRISGTTDSQGRGDNDTTIRTYP